MYVAAPGVGGGEMEREGRPGGGWSWFQETKMETEFLRKRKPEGSRDQTGGELRLRQNSTGLSHFPWLSATSKSFHVLYFGKFPSKEPG